MYLCACLCVWSTVQVITNLVKMVKARDIRRPFCPAGHWLSEEVNIRADKVPHCGHVCFSFLDVTLDQPIRSIKKHRSKFGVYGEESDLSLEIWPRAFTATSHQGATNMLRLYWCELYHLYLLLFSPGHPAVCPLCAARVANAKNGTYWAASVHTRW